jgi:hypothetical protein
MLTTSQFISIIVVAASIVLIFIGKRASADGPIPESPWWEQPDPNAVAANVEEEADEEEEDEEEEEDDGEQTQPDKDPPRKNA